MSSFTFCASLYTAYCCALVCRSLSLFCFSRHRGRAGLLVVPGFDGRVGTGAEGGAPVGLRVLLCGGAAAAL